MSKEKKKTRDERRTAAGDRTGEGGVFSCTRPVVLPFGIASAVLRDGLLHSVEWERSPEDLEAVLSEKFPRAKPIDPGRCGAGQILLAYSEGRAVWPDDVAAVRIEWDRARGFQRMVLKTLARVPYGSTISYGGLARRIGKKNAARAVGAALSRNPWPVILPCHRVVGANGGMTGFGKGVQAKRILLAFERRSLPVAGRRESAERSAIRPDSRRRG